MSEKKDVPQDSTKRLSRISLALLLITIVATLFFRDSGRARGHIGAISVFIILLGLVFAVTADSKKPLSGVLLYVVSALCAVAIITALIPVL